MYTKICLNFFFAEIHSLKCRLREREKKEAEQHKNENILINSLKVYFDWMIDKMNELNIIRILTI